MVSAVVEPTQPTLRRMRRFGIRPNRELGQNFLIDSNILGVVERAAELSPADVALEIGGGLGVLSEHLAERVAYVHVVEVDRRLEAALKDALAPHENAGMHWGDAMRIDLAALRPAPTKVIANLPYGVATSALLRTIEELPSVELWVAMVQREVGRRLAAQPGGREYGVSSVIAQFACEVRVIRSVPRTVFFPVPNVDSVLVRMRRTGPAPPLPLRQLVHAAFAHRRKALARSLQMASGAQQATAGETGGSSGGGQQMQSGALKALPRASTQQALEALGLPADVRAERLAPEQFRALAEALGL